MAVIGCYTLDLYCDRGGDEYGGACPYDPNGKKKRGAVDDYQFTGRTLRECQKNAIHKGWRFYDHGTKAICPACTREGYKWKKENDKWPR